ncbi:hypothetical protein ACO0QE_000231 [Hanseniaspora vineae]
MATKASSKKMTQSQKKKSHEATPTNMKNNIVSEKSFVQVEVDLSKPLDKDAPPTIYSTPLKPEYATAAMNLSVDFLRQDESLANKYVFWHPFCWSIVFLMMAIQCKRSIVLPPAFINVFQYYSAFYETNKKKLLTLLILFCISLTLASQFLTRFVKMYYLKKVVEIEDGKGENVFQLNLQKLANLDKSLTKDLTTLNNCNIIFYRNAPIALTAIDTRALFDTPKKDGEESTKENVVVIKTLGCRKVYLDSGLLEDLLQWTILRTKDLLNSGESTGPSSAKIVAEVFFFNLPLKKALTSCHFKLEKSEKIKNNFILGSLLGFEKQTYSYEVSV